MLAGVLFIVSFVSFFDAEDDLQFLEVPQASDTRLAERSYLATDATPIVDEDVNDSIEAYGSTPGETQIASVSTAELAPVSAEDETPFARALGSKQAAKGTTKHQPEVAARLVCDESTRTSELSIDSAASSLPTSPLTPLDTPSCPGHRQWKAWNSPRVSWPDLSPPGWYSRVLSA
jgi:hypothetical protein